MKNITAILFLLVFCLAANAQDENAFVMPAAADYPALPKSGTLLEDFLPAKWEMVANACGDLNGDRTEDCVLIMAGADTKFMNKNDGLGRDPFDTNPRVMAIVYKEPGKNEFRLGMQNNSFIRIPDGPTMDEPFADIRIKNGILELDFRIWYSAGSWGTSQYTYKFRPGADGTFKLIGAEKTESMRNTGETTTRSYNFVTNRLKISKGNFTDDKTKPKVTWKVLKKVTDEKLKNFINTTPFDWEIETDDFL